MRVLASETQPRPLPDVCAPALLPAFPPPLTNLIAAAAAIAVLPSLLPPAPTFPLPLFSFLCTTVLSALAVSTFAFFCLFCLSAAAVRRFSYVFRSVRRVASACILLH
jgi:hypothetical protein